MFTYALKMIDNNISGVGKWQTTNVSGTKNMDK